MKPTGGPYRVVDLTSSLPPAKPYVKRSSTVRYIAVHHTDGPVDQSAKIIHDYHISKGWSGIGYHYLVRRVGEDGLLLVEKVRPVVTIPACVRGFNSTSVCVAFAGSYNDTPPPKELIDKAAVFIMDLCLAFPGSEVKGHREFPLQETDCPGKAFPLEELKRKVRSLLYTTSRR